MNNVSGNGEGSTEQLGSFRTITRLFTILDILSKNHGGLSLSAIARELQAVPKSSVFNLLKQMEKGHMLHYDHDTKVYRIGSGMIRLSSVIMHNYTLQPSARPLLEKISKETGEDAYLGICDEQHIVYIDKVEGTQSIRLNIAVGVPRALHNTAIGKLFLAYMPEEWLQSVLDENSFIATARNTITTSERMMEEIANIRAEQISISNEESIDGVFGIAAPIFNKQGEIAAGIGLSMPTRRAIDRLPFIKEIVLQTAAEISEMFGM